MPPASENIHMDERVLDEQRELVERINDAGWIVTDAELSVYESPWEDDVPEATVTLTARKAFPESETGGRNVPAGERERDPDDSPFRVK